MTADTVEFDQFRVAARRCNTVSQLTLLRDGEQNICPNTDNERLIEFDALESSG